VVGGTLVVGTVVVAGGMVDDVTTVLGRVVLDVALIVEDLPPNVTIAVMAIAATAAIVATMIIVRFRSSDGLLSGTVRFVPAAPEFHHRRPLQWPVAKKARARAQSPDPSRRQGVRSLVRRPGVHLSGAVAGPTNSSD